MLIVVGLVPFVIGESAPGKNPSGMRGKVTDRINHTPVANAYIFAHRNGAPGPDVQTSTDKEGNYTVALPVGIYDAFISADYYTPTCRKVQVEPDGMMVFDAGLDPNPLGGQID